MRPPCTVDVAAQDAGQSDPHWRTAASSARRAVHECCVADTAARSPGRSENVGCSTGFALASLEATRSGALGWENRSELSMWCPSNEEVGRYALLTNGRRSNRKLISFVMRLRFAMTARTRFIPYCTGVDMNARADCLSGGASPLHPCRLGRSCAPGSGNHALPVPGPEPMNSTTDPRATRSTYSPRTGRSDTNIHSVPLPRLCEPTSVARGGIEPPTFRFSGGGEVRCEAFVLVKLDELDQFRRFRTRNPNRMADAERIKTDPEPLDCQELADPVTRQDRPHMVV